MPRPTCQNLTRQLCVVIFASVFAVPLAGQQDLAVRIPYKNRSYVGRPLAWDGNEMMLLRRDGNISILPVKSKDDYLPLETRFAPYSRDDIRRRLQREFGSKYQISMTANFVVVHPPGDFQIWAMPFEELYHRFEVYFSSRGYDLEKSEFPMVAVVLRTRGEFDRFLTAYHFYDQKILGYYSPRSNRIITYDQSNGQANSQSKGQDWFFNTKTIIHEATHQTAFNLGVHSRYAPVVRWVSEGLAMLFEADGINNSVVYTRAEDRINRSRLVSLKAFYREEQVKGKMRELVFSDDLFRTDPLLAYAVSWGMTFYFTEKMPEKYHEFLRSDSQRTDFADYPPRQRAAGFAAAFGKDWVGMEARMKRFFEDIEVPEESQ